MAEEQKKKTGKRSRKKGAAQAAAYAARLRARKASHIKKSNCGNASPMPVHKIVPFEIASGHIRIKGSGPFARQSARVLRHALTLAGVNVTGLTAREMKAML